jgi:trimeric autotransporter adhesin
MSSPSRSFALRVLAAVLVVASCDSTEPAPPPQVTVSGDAQTGVVGEPLLFPLSVRVTNRNGQPLSGLRVQWAVTSGGGVLSAAESTTNQSGEATVQWTLGPALGAQQVTASVPGAVATVFTATAVAPVAVTVEPTAVTLAAGQTRPLSVTVTGAGNPAVTWSSTSPEIAFVSANGVLQAVGVGTARVTATSVQDPTKSAGVDVTVVPPVAVDVTPATFSIPAGQTQALTATVTGATNTAVTWSTSAGDVAVVDANGVVRGIAPGQATITATSVEDPTKSGTATATITSAVAISVSPTAVSVPVGLTTALTATVTGTPNTAVTWGSSNIFVATVDANGVVTAVAPGAATITVRSVADPQRTADATVTVTPAIGVSVQPPTASMETGQTRQFTAVVSGTANQGVTWTTSNPAVATVSASGLVTAVGAGAATITARSVVDTTKTATAQVSVVPPVVVTVSPALVDLPLGAVTTLTAAVTGTQNPAVVWSSSDTTVATVDTLGVVRTRAEGSALITATSVADPTRSGSATILVGPPVTVTVSPASLGLLPGDQFQLTATVQGHANTAVIWSSSNPDVVSVTQTGLITALTGGIATVRATSAVDTSKSGTATVTVTGASPVTVTVLPRDLRLALNQSYTMAANVTGTGNTAVTWTSSDPATVAVDAGGTVTGLQVGPALITATSVADPAARDTVTVVVNAPGVVGITVTPLQATIPVNSVLQLDVSVTGTADQSVTWTSSNPAVATVDATGLVTGVAVGQVNITATSVADPSRSFTVQIRVQ